MRRLGVLFSSTLLVIGLGAPALAASGGHQGPHPGARTFLNYGPRKHEVVVNARATAYAATAVDLSKDTTSICTTTDDSGNPLPTRLCVWYEAPSLTQDSDVATPTYAAQVLGTLQHVESTYLAAGYRAVEPWDSAAPYGGQMNLFLHDLGGGSGGLYGYTSTQDQNGGLLSSAGHDRPAYMVIDNDFAASQYPDANGFPGCAGACSTAIMQVTIAHEFFHATQFAYDALTADTWFMESTATWAETQVYPNLHDNWLYFNVPDGVLSNPRVPLDDNAGSSSTEAFYQNFVWNQYLGKAFPARTGAMPTIIRNAWQYLDSRNGQPKYFSVTALNHAIDVASGHTASLASTWLAFSAGNRHHVLGAHYPNSNAVWSRTVSPSNLGQAKVSSAVNHLASQTFVLTPSHLASTERMHLAVRIANPLGTVAGVTMYYRTGAIRTYPLVFSQGYAMRNFGFDSSSLLRVELTIGNASSSYTNCWSGATNWACDGGTPVVSKAGFTWTGSFFHL